ncbi:hypothetical protein HBB16_11495, partial [Pseudonocardia sp. MCCB 268]|nr:hypothetical protein [Pseudonocardia cytotoxica]
MAIPSPVSSSSGEDSVAQVIGAHGSTTRSTSMRRQEASCRPDCSRNDATGSGSQPRSADVAGAGSLGRFDASVQRDDRCDGGRSRVSSRRARPSARLDVRARRDRRRLARRRRKPPGPAAGQQPGCTPIRCCRFPFVVVCLTLACSN